MLKIGCHLSISKGLLNASKETVSINGNTFQFFSRNPQGFKQKEFDEKDYQEFLKYNQENNLFPPLCHALYTLNCCSKDERVRELAKMILEADLKRMSSYGYFMYNMHPGAHVGQGVDEGIELIANTLNDVVKPDYNGLILLELMAGKGSDIGRSFQEIRAILDKLILKDKFGVCLDTCHVFAAGYDIVNDLDGVLIEFDKIIGLDKLKALHLNDSKMPFKSFKDRHAPLGQGYIGLDTFIKIINHKALKKLPMYLETPHETLLGYKEEIAFLKENYLE